jgi:predicted permease
VYTDFTIESDTFVTIIIGFSLAITTFGQPLEIQQKDSSTSKIARAFGAILFVAGLSINC